MKKTFKVATLAVAAAALLAGCGNNANTMKKLQKEGYTQAYDNNEAMFYKVTTENAEGKTIAEGDVVLAEACMRMDDSVLIPKNGQSQPICMAGKAQNSLDFSEVMIGRHVGEAITIAICADSIAAQVGAHQMPPMYTEGAGNVMYYDFVITDAMTQEALEAKSRAEAEAYRVADSAARIQYIKDHNITVKPSKTGLYRIITKQGSGAKVANGKNVEVHYTGRLLDGTKFDSSYDRNEPIAITEGAHQVIQGWEEGLLDLPEGTQATLIIPSELAYGDRATGPIPPYSTLVFEVEVMSVK